MRDGKLDARTLGPFFMVLRYGVLGEGDVANEYRTPQFPTARPQGLWKLQLGLPPLCFGRPFPLNMPKHPQIPLNSETSKRHPGVGTPGTPCTPCTHHLLTILAPHLCCAPTSKSSPDPLTELLFLLFSWEKVTSTRQHYQSRSSGLLTNIPFLTSHVFF